ncbi:MAG: MogA/MoaB family molybdenum cofactor biosynthesis protein [Firmicutes bacterium]|nr:MogA/MoaB family molybdenum cofactor biosynthesis protein [Bacillota bacterium]
MIKAAVITVSDKGSQGLREDLSGPLAIKLLEEISIKVVKYLILPDERDQISTTLKILCDNNEANLIITTGGTGLAPRDITPEATLDILERQAPGIAEVIRLKSLEKTPKAMLSRAVAGIRKSTLIINLPGSPKAVQESLEVILPVLPQAIEILTSTSFEH